MWWEARHISNALRPLFFRQRNKPEIPYVVGGKAYFERLYNFIQK
jgi:hypothetical protein